MPGKASFISRKYAFLYLKYVNAHPYIIDMFQFVLLVGGWVGVGVCVGVCMSLYHACLYAERRSRGAEHAARVTAILGHNRIFASSPQSTRRERGSAVHLFMWRKV